MKKVILVIFVGFISSCAPTLRKGEYCHEIVGGEGGPCVKFEKNYNFKWQTSYDFGPPTIGSGEYRIRKDSLHLKFKKDSVAYESTVEVLDSVETGEDEISLEIKVVDQQRMPSPQALVTLDKYPAKKNYTNPDGVVKIENIEKSENPIKIKTEPRELLETHSFELIPNKNTELLVTLYKAKPELISDTTFVYEIIEKGRKKLTLKNSSGQTLEFKRIEK